MGDSINIGEKSVLERYIHCNSAHIPPPDLSIIQSWYDVKLLESPFFVRMVARRMVPVPLLKLICRLHYFLYGDTIVDKLHHMFHIRIDVMIEFFQSRTEVV